MILIAYGTRPEYIKLKPILSEMNRVELPYKLLFTGQHKDIITNKFAHYKMNIMNGENRLDSIVMSLMGKLSHIIKADKITHVMVQGDTTSALAVALSAFHHGLKVIHLEAGLRTYDRENPYPEEANRRMISQIANIHLCPTTDNFKNLVNEKIYGDDIFVVGNTVIDNLLPFKDKCEYTDKILITLHRRENHHWMDKWFTAINELAKSYRYEFILPIHPNPEVQKYRSILTNVKVVEPMVYPDLINLLVKTRLVITDSGGLQEECSFLNKKCLVCRKVTERPEAIGKSSFMVHGPDDLINMFARHSYDYKIDYNCPYGDGHSAEKITEILKEILNA